ncbi:MAG: lipase maturation factor family protein [Deltaproteobacteria bacterium]|nr:lipase maturation factor family protein [Deltaproteobacteria bacterium]
MAPALFCDIRTARGLSRAARWADLLGPAVVIRAAAAEGAPASGDVRLELPDGRVLWNARALAEVRRGALWAWCVRRSWLAAEVAELVWRLGAALAPVLAIASPLLRGESLVAPRTTRTRALVLRVIGLALACAAASWWAQVDGLVGSNGVAPAAEWLEAVRAHAERAGQSALVLAPTLLWLDASDEALHATCLVTTLAGALMLLGWAPGWAALVGFVGYLSLVATGGVFMGYQWDELMLEALVVAMLLAPWTRRALARAVDVPPPVSGIALARVVAFKLYFMSGIVKLASGDPVWADWTALDYHLWTQPLPSPTSFLALGAPAWVLSGLTAFTLFAELVLPWALLLPAPLRRVRVLATALMLLLQVGIAATGNFGYFNILSFGILLAGLDDDALRGWGRAARGWRPRPRPAAVGWRAWLGAPRALAAGALLVITLFEVRQVWLRDAPPALVAEVTGALAPLRISNTYGLFANMTTSRPEIEIQGSDDGRAWLTYDLAWKPDHERDAPRFAGPHMPRLDWQLWFAALAGDCQRARWYTGLLRRLLEGAPEVIALFGSSPFGDRPPRYLRSLVWDYAPAPPGSGGLWWIRQDARAFCPDVTWRDGRLQRVHFGPAPSATDGEG